MGKQFAESFDCAAGFALTILNGKWNIDILLHLKQRPRRYSQLRAAIPGLSDKMLTQRLHDLTDSGVVTHRRSINSPIGHYTLTPKGKRLETLIQGIAEWGHQHSRYFQETISRATRSGASRKKPR